MIKNFLSYILKTIDKLRLNNNNFVIISNNCWGAEIYNSVNRKYNTPFVGLFVYGPCYIKLLENFEFYMSQELKFRENSIYQIIKPNYPVGYLIDIEIHFLHYDSEIDAKEKWYRRIKRMNQVLDKNNYYFKMCDRDRTDKEIIDRFHNLPFKNKISFGIKGNNSLYHILIGNSGDVDHLIPG